MKFYNLNSSAWELLEEVQNYIRETQKLFAQLETAIPKTKYPNKPVHEISRGDFDNAIDIAENINFFNRSIKRILNLYGWSYDDTFMGSNYELIDILKMLATDHYKR